jgi:hypothetical protein
MDLNALRRIERLNYVLAGVLVIVGALVFDRAMALGVLVGAVLSCVNFSFMRVLVGKAMAAPDGQRSGKAFFMMPKMAGLMLLVFLAIRFLPITGLGLLVGFSVFLVSIAVETVRMMTNPPAANGNSAGGRGDDE